MPIVAVDRIEILKDGASTVYGSDAVAGVVNVITRKDDGLSFDAYTAQPTDTGGAENRLSLRWGSSFCLLYTSPSPRDLSTSRMPSSA